MLYFRPFPETFVLHNLATITSRAFSLKANPHIQLVAETVRQWFLQFGTLHAKEYTERGRFDTCAALGFPEADPQHLETCLTFLYWAFAIDDLSDEGDLQADPDSVLASVNICRQALYNIDAPPPAHLYAAMTHNLFRRIKATASPGACSRFIRAYQAFSESQINQSRSRSEDKSISVEDFILSRRATIGAALVEAMVEYSLDLEIPDYVFEDPIVKAMSDATADIMAWPNDLCSFNKEQADNDFQNLVCCVMIEHNVELQGAVDILTKMLEMRVDQYLDYKKRLPSFGEEVDLQVGIYYRALEHFVQGTLVWLYMSPRYFSETERIQALDSRALSLNLKQPSE